MVWSISSFCVQAWAESVRDDNRQSVCVCAATEVQSADAVRESDRMGTYGKACSGVCALEVVGESVAHHLRIRPSERSDEVGTFSRFATGAHVCEPVRMHAHC